MSTVADITVTISFEDAQQLARILGERPHNEQWSNRVWEELLEEIDFARTTHEATRQWWNKKVAESTPEPQSLRA